MHATNGLYYLSKSGLHKLPDGWALVPTILAFTLIVGVILGYAWRIHQVGW